MSDIMRTHTLLAWLVPSTILLLGSLVLLVLRPRSFLAWLFRGQPARQPVHRRFGVARATARRPIGIVGRAGPHDALIAMAPSDAVRWLLVALALLGCGSETPDVDVVIASGASALELTIELQARRADASPQVEYLAVTDAGRSGSKGGSVYWAIVRRPDSATVALPARLAYGTPPPGYAVARRPTALPLPPGRYEADVRTTAGHAYARFRIGSDGRVK